MYKAWEKGISPREFRSCRPEDIKDILQVNPEILVLGKGNPGMMKASKDLKEFLQNKGILLLEEPSAQAVDTFNNYLEQGKKVCAGFHLTC